MNPHSRTNRPARTNSPAGRNGPERGKQSTDGPIDLRVPISEEQVLRFLGYPAGRDPSVRVGAALQAALEEARGRVAARGVSASIDPVRGPEFGLPIREASEIILGLVTAGPELELRAEAALREGEVTRALFLEAAGSTAAEEAAEMLSEGACRVSPGYGAWGLEWQRALFDLLPHDRLGVRLLPSLLMIPRKSVSFAYWIGRDGGVLAVRSGCSACGLTPCPHRREASAV